jgi:hypothetical protein
LSSGKEIVRNEWRAITAPVGNGEDRVDAATSKPLDRSRGEVRVEHFLSDGFFAVASVEELFPALDSRCE